MEISKIQSKSFVLLVFILFLSSSSGVLGKTLPPHPLFGVTIENLNSFDLSQLNELLQGDSPPLTIRVIFQDRMLPADYQGKLEEIKEINDRGNKKKIYVLATLYDSDYLADYKIKSPLKPESDFKCDKLGRGSKDYRYRTFCFVKDLNHLVDIWEVGNEVNGEWADEGCEKENGECKSRFDQEQQKYLPVPAAYPKRTIEKIEYAISLAKRKDKPIALTLLHQPDCTTWSDNDMFKWVEKNVTDTIRFNTDYLLVSYYEYNCNEGRGTSGNNYWKTEVFDRLNEAQYFPNRFLGFGEVGYPSETISCENGRYFCDPKKRDPIDKKKLLRVGEKINLMEKYYRLNVDNDKFIGGYFWWTFQQDTDCSIKENGDCRAFSSAINRIFKKE